MDRRALLAAGVVAVLSVTRKASARDYTSASEVLATIDGLARDVGASLDAIAASLPGARPLADSVRADHVRQRAERAAIRRRLGLAASAPPPAPAPSRDLGALRALQQELVHAHAEGLPALDDPAAVQALAGHMVDLSRHLTVIDLWIETEGGE